MTVPRRGAERVDSDLSDGGLEAVCEPGPQQPPCDDCWPGTGSGAEV